VVDPVNLNLEHESLLDDAPDESPADWSEADRAGLESSLLDAVEITTERLTGRQTFIGANIYVPCSAEQVWQVLTDYDRLADFIPNLEQSRCIDTSKPNQVRLEQMGSECFFNLKFCARVVLDMVEHFPNRIDFSMVEGDFKSFVGFWAIAPLDQSSQPGVQLSYGVTVIPTRLMPIRLIERHLRKNLVLNLAAIRQRAVDLAAA
jgi:ribosome-associated toxin RatA of RatAB toxin-antitoxin module